ncbi:Eukaryotic aspartyl protease [Aphelenchoides besseyi]|nr:Eukaryotic aspartyl protease [Aphelenchoides besseyi]
MHLLVFFVLGIAIANASITFPLKRTFAKEETPGLLTRLRDIFSDRLKNKHDVIYKGTVYVGTPPKAFNVVFDTGSGVFWLPIKGCKSSGPHADACKSKDRTYDPKESTTSKRSRRSFRLHYGTGHAFGRYYTDNVQFGSSNNKSMKMDNVLIGAANHIEYIDHGIVGLSLPASRQAKPLFFEASMWRFVVSEFKVGSYSASTIQKYAITDTGTSYIQIPTKFFQNVVDELKAEKMKGYYVMPCDSKFEMEFTINGKTFKVSEKEVLLNQGYGQKCVVAIGDAGMFDMFLLGDAFVRGWCQVYDIKEKKVGFAPVKQ